MYRYPRVRSGRCDVSPLRLLLGMMQWSLVIVLMCVGSVAYADLPAFISNNTTDTNNNSIAVIGETITYQCTSLCNPAPILGEVQIFPGGPVLNTSAFSNLGSNIYRYTINFGPITEGLQNGVQSPAQFFITNASGTLTCAPVSFVTLDNRPPVRAGPFDMTVNGLPYTGQILHRGDVLGFSQSMDGTAYQAGETATLNMTAIGLGTLSLTTGNPHTGNYTISAVVDTPPGNTTGDLTLQMVDPNGNATSATVLTGVTIDSRVPVISSTNIIVTPAGLARPGSTVTIQVNVATYDNDTVTASCTYLGGSSLPLAWNGTRFEGTFTVASSPPAAAIVGSTFADITVTDNGFNVATATTNTFPIDNRLPLLDPQPNAQIIQNNGVLSDSIAIVGDHLTIAATATWDPVQYPTAHVYVDLSSLGGAAQVEIPQVGATSYFLDYTLPIGISEETPTKSFRVWAIDQATGNTIQDWTTPLRAIDNVPPQVVSATVSRVTGSGTSYKTGEQLRIRAQVNNLNTAELGAAGAVTVQIASLSLLYTNTQLLNPDPGAPGFFEGIFTVGSFPPGVGWDRTAFDIRVVASDHAGNIGTGTANTGIPLDNEPPIIGTTSFSFTHNWNPNLDDGFARIGDTVAFHVRLATPPIDVCQAYVDLSAIGLSSSQLMVASSTPGAFTYIINSLATGTINRNTAVVFPIRVVDNNENQDVSSVTIPIDNNPPDPGALTVAISYQPGLTDPYPNFVNLNKNLQFDVPLSLDVPDDHATGTLITDIFRLVASETMTYAPTNYTHNIDTATQTANNASDSYRFKAMITDQSGNAVWVYTAPYKVDCYPPKIASLSATIVGAGSVATISRLIRIRAQVSDHDGNNPTVDLTSIGGSDSQVMTSIGVNLYEYIATVATGTLQTVPASWSVTIMDASGNKVASHTNPITVDNQPPTPGPLLVSWDDTPTDGRMKMGDLASFTITTLDPDPGTATVNLTAIGSVSAVVMAFSAPDFYVEWTGTKTNAEYLNYSFTAMVTDVNGNRVYLTSAPVLEVDCQPASFSNLGIVITQTNGDNPLPNVVNTGDVLTVFASISYYLDAAATATIWVATPQEAPMTFVAARNRHEATFTVPPGTGAWGNLNLDTLSYSASATDNVGNLSQTAVQVSTFTVKNQLPTILTSSFLLNPDYPTLTPYLNVGSSSIGDRLLASATLDDLVTSASINLSAVPGAPAWYPLSISGASGYTPTSIAFTSYPLTDLIDATFTITLRDQAGNPATASQLYRVDTRRPSITSATFDGTVLTVNLSEEFVNLASSQYRIVGSLTNGLTTYMAVSSGTIVEALTSFDATFGIVDRKTLAAWASTPIYLEVISVATAPLTDLAENWLPGYARYPITITDSTWRTPAKIVNFIVDTTNWPTAIGIDLIFDRAMATDTLIASKAVLLTGALGYEFTSVDYTTGYVFQASDTPSWLAADQLHFDMCADAVDWIARKLGSGTTRLYFANRSSVSVFVQDELGRGSQLYPTSAPLPSLTVDRPPASLFRVQDPPGNITLNIGSGTLDVNLSQKALLYTNDFVTVDGTAPTMGMPVPSFSRRTTAFHSKFIFYDQDPFPATFTRLTLQALELAANPQLATTSIHLKLTDADMNAVLTLWRNNQTPLWGMRVDAGAFTNWWDQATQLYLPSGNPGNVDVIAPTTAGTAGLAAAAISDPPPTRNWAPGTLGFEFDFAPHYIGNVPVPLASNTPIARIASGVDTLATGTFLGWVTRTVAGKTRYTARFVNETSMPDGLQSLPASLEIWNVQDVFGNSLGTIATNTVYDLALRNGTDVRGYSSGTAILVIDTATPTVTDISPYHISRAIAGGLTVTVTFSEPMDTSVAPPVLTVATTTPVSTIAFNAGVWSAGGTQVTYTNAAAIPAGLNPQGQWNYRLTAAGRDLAGNAFPGDTTRTVDVRTNAPPITSSYLTLTKRYLTATPTVDVPENLPFSSSGALGGTAVASFTYSDTPINLPHTLRLIAPGGASVALPLTVNVAGLQADVTIDSTSFGSPVDPWGPASYHAQIYDSFGNIIDIATFVYDSRPPQLNSLIVNGAASYASGIWYATSSAPLSVAVNTVTTDTLFLTAYSTAWTGIASFTPGSTATINLNQTSPGVYSGSLNTPSGFSEGVFDLGVCDLAGNITASTTPLQLVIDQTRPTVISIAPDTSWPIPNSPALAVTCTVTFSEPMNGNPTLAPTLALATTTPLAPPYASNTISFVFIGWTSSDTAQFVNVAPIGTEYRSGDYSYVVTGGRDLAGNTTDYIVGAFAANVQSEGPAAKPTVWSQQPLIASAPTDWVASMPVQSPGIARIELLYLVNPPPNLPHDLLVFDWTGTQIATYAVPAPDPTGVATVPVDIVTDGWNPPADPVGPLTYTLRMRDGLNNTSNVIGTFTYDSMPATVASFSLTDTKGGIASGGYRFYSPIANTLTVRVQTDATDTQRLILVDELLAATSTQSLTRVGATSTHTTTLTSLPDSTYTFYIADLAGNLGIGAASTVPVIVDGASPTVTAATPITVGALAARTGLFTITFNEPMNPSYVPTVRLATTTSPTTIALIATPSAAACWVDAYTCRFTNDLAVGSAQSGEYYYTVTDARDYAGNQNVPPAVGALPITIFTTAPSATMRVWTQQPLLDDPPTAWISGRPFSPPENNGIASITLTYSGVVPVAQSLLMYNSANQQVASYAVALSGMTGEVAIDSPMSSWTVWVASGGPSPFTFKLIDNYGNLSATLNASTGGVGRLIYDSRPASVSSFVFSDVGIASGGIKYYSPLLGNTTITMSTNATDTQRLVMSALPSHPLYPATWTAQMTQTSPTSGVHQVATGSTLPEGQYLFTAADLAQNFATGPAWFRIVEVDASQPVVIGITPSTALGGSPIYSSAAGAITFDVQFSEPMSSATVPVVKLVNGTFQMTLVASPTAPACWIDATTCRFTNAQPITATFPQGLYNYVVTGGRDYAGNTAVSSNGAFQLEIQSRGPTITSYVTSSQQATTASGTPWPTLLNQPFSFLVAPYEATLTVTLSTASGSAGSRVHFIQGNSTVASVSLNWDPTWTIGTFTWNSTTGPSNPNGSPYILKFYDANMNPSLETGIWTMDATAPRVLATPTVSDLSTTSQVLYYSMSVTPNVNFSFRSDETSGLRLRQTGMGATDTRVMTRQTGTTWTAVFNGRFSDGTIATDGMYQFDLVDTAGNVGVAAAGIGTSAYVIIDTVRPIVSTYTLRAGGVGPVVTRFSTLAASLSIELTIDPSTPYGPEGVWEVEVLNDSGQVINRLPLIASGTNYVAWWNGTNFSGTTVLDGTYTFRTRDAAGNKATLTTSVFAVTSPFRLLGGEELTSTAIKLYFNHPVDATTLPPVSAFAPPTVNVSSYTFVNPQTLIASLSGPLAHGLTYTFTIATPTLRNTDGSPLTEGQNSFTFMADAAGPAFATPAITFTGITTAREFFVNFNEEVTAPTALATGNYIINGGAISVVTVALQTNRTSVRVTTAADLSSGQNYTLTVNGVEDKYRNPSAVTTTFQGRDMVAPTFRIGIFSNPANEYDLVVAASASEALSGNPKVKVTQNGAAPIEYSMTPGISTNTYMSGVHLDANYPGAGWAEIQGTDLAGNVGTTLASFTIAVVNASVRAEVKSPDGQFTGVFAAGSVKQKTAVKWLPRGSLKQNAMTNVLAGAIRKNANIKASVHEILPAQEKELQPWGSISELSMPGGRLLKPFALQVHQLPNDQVWGLYLQNSSGEWVWQSAINASGTAAAVMQTGVFGVFRDTLAPRVTMTTSFPETPLSDSRPVIEGRVEEFGSGLNGTVEVVIDGHPQSAVVDAASGTFRFQPLEPLSSGEHEVLIRAADRSGNVGETAAIRFLLNIPLQVAEMISFPNPARERVTLRITANSKDLDLDAMSIKIYDLSGDRVIELNGMAPRLEAGIYRYDIPWDLRNENGSKVANGVYLARFEIRDPDNPQKKIKQTHKIAILR